LLGGQPACPWEAWSMVPYLASAWREPERDVETRLLTNFKELVGLA